MNDTTNKSEQIARLNDLLRAHLTTGKLMFTAGVTAMSEADQQAIMQRVRVYDNFNEEHTERRFGTFSYDLSKIYWQIDYYSSDLSEDSPDASNPDQTQRILTVMLADEY